MIKANELRIGNLIKDASGQIHSVTAGTIMYLRDAEESDYNNCNPIPLTEEILLKCEFVNHWQNKFKHNDFYLECWGEDIHYTAGQGIALSTIIRYLHQLQNLYFALTGQELNTEGLVS